MTTPISVRPAEAESSDTERPLRADARRNRERLITAAREIFTEQGSGASMEAIAKQAGVGVGTLYRHFPNRFDIVEAVYETDVHELADAAQRVVAELDPWEAVVAFFNAFMRYAQTKQALLAELQQAFEKNPDMKSRARESISASFDLVIDRAKEAGVMRDDVDGSDLMQMVSPICTNASVTPEQTRRMIGILLDGLKVTSKSGV
jgi:AcrR family transcriptional regulator